MQSRQLARDARQRLATHVATARLPADRRRRARPARRLRIFAPSVLRPMRRCSCANGSGSPSFHGMISPSSTVPSGRNSAASASSGKRSVTSSSPRDQMNVCPSRRITCARMPSHFHSACHSAGVAELLELALERVREDRTDTGARRRRRGVSAASSAVNDSARRLPRARSTDARSTPSSTAARARQRTHDELLRHADTKAAGDQLVPDEALGRRRAPATRRASPRAAPPRVLRRERQQPLARSSVQRHVRRASAPSRQQQRHRLREIADGVDSTRRTATRGCRPPPSPTPRGAERE